MGHRTQNTSRPHLSAVFPVLLAKFIVLLIAALVLWCCHGLIAGYSGLCGGLISLLPDMYFASKAFEFSGTLSAQSIVRSFYTGEAGKVIFTVVLFALTFSVLNPLSPLAVFGVFVLTQLVIWFAPLLMKTRF